MPILIDCKQNGGVMGLVSGHP